MSMRRNGRYGADVEGDLADFFAGRKFKNGSSCFDIFQVKTEKIFISNSNTTFKNMIRFSNYFSF